MKDIINISLFISFILSILISKAAYSENDSIVFTQLITKSEEFKENDSANASIFAQKALTFANNHNNDSWKAISLTTLGNIYSTYFNYIEAAQTYIEAINIYKKINNLQGVADVSLLNGVVNKKIANYPEAINYTFTALRIYEAKNQTEKTAKALNNLGNIYYSQNNYEFAEKYYLKALDNFKKINNPKEIAQIFSNLSLIYVSKQDYDSALKFSDLSLNYFISINDSNFIGMTYNNLGDIWYYKMNIDKSLDFYLKALAIHTNTNNELYKITVYNNIAEIYYDKKNYLLSEEYALKAYNLAKKFNSLEDVLWASTTLVNIYISNSNSIKGHKFFDIFITTKSEVTNMQVSQQIAEMQTKYETEKKQQLITNLNKEKDLQNELLSKQKYIIVFIVFVLILMIYLAFTIYNRYKTKIKTNQLLSKQNAEILEQKTIIDNKNHLLEEQTKKLKELDALKTKFFDNISHELRTPLTLIMAPAEKLLEQQQKSESKLEYELIYKQSRKLYKLITQLLDISKLEKGIMPLKVSKDDISSFTHLVFSTFTSLANERNIQYSCEIEESIFIYFDKDKIEKILNNLIFNAFKYSKPNGIIKLELNKSFDKKHVNICLIDNGIGISQEKLPYIFDRFYQVETEFASQYEGSGIGLALTKELVDLHKGKITVESNINSGSKFIVSLPIDDNTYQESEIDKTTEKNLNELQIHENNELSLLIETNNSENIPKSNKLTILVVEDNIDMRKYISSCLNILYNIEEAENGVVGYTKAIELNPDLIISDVMMPLKDGFQLTEDLKSDNRTSHIPIILLTAKSSEESLHKGLEKEADAYLLKPFNVKELLLRIKNLIGFREKLREKFKKCITVNPSDITTCSLDEIFLQKALQSVEDNMSNGDFDVELLCEAVGMSRTHLHRKLKAITNQSATEFIRSIRLKRAAQLIKQKAGSISEIAYDVGFNQVPYFTKCFKDMFGVNPSEY